MSNLSLHISFHTTTWFSCFITVYTTLSSAGECWSRPLRACVEPHVRWDQSIPCGQSSIGGCAWRNVFLGFLWAFWWSVWMRGRDYLLPIQTPQNENVPPVCRFFTEIILLKIWYCNLCLVTIKIFISRRWSKFIFSKIRIYWLWYSLSIHTFLFKITLNHDSLFRGVWGGTTLQAPLSNCKDIRPHSPIS